jgi:BMFP domain-containing protein YqiC
MNAIPELESLVTFERKRNAELEEKIAKLEATEAKAKPAADK